MSFTSEKLPVAGSLKCFLESNRLNKVRAWLTLEIKKRVNFPEMHSHGYLLFSLKDQGSFTKSHTFGKCKPRESDLWNLETLSLRMGSKYYLPFLILGQKLQ